MAMGTQCRLCLKDSDLRWMFSTQLPANMCEMVYVTTGVRISKTDKVTQMVCEVCCQLSSKMYRFRTYALKNDSDLRAKLTEEDTHKKPPKKAKTLVVPPMYKKAHHSIKSIILQYPGIKLPQNISLSTHYGPYITLMSNEVENWFASRTHTPPKVSPNKKPNSTTKENKLKRPSSVLAKPIKPTPIIKRAKLNQPIRKPFVETKPENPRLDSSGSSTTSSTDLSGNPTKRRTPRPITYNEDLTCEVNDNLVISNQQNTTKKFRESGSESSNDSNKTVLYQMSVPTSSDINTFAKCLDLTPTRTPPEVTSTNNSHPVPEELSELYSQVQKATKVYTCKVCDSLHNSMKELKKHEHRTHTKCTLCSKRFKTVQNRDDHMRSCTLVASTKLKTMKLQLTRIDEVEEVRKQYPNAFTTQSPILRAVLVEPQEIVQITPSPERIQPQSDQNNTCTTPSEVPCPIRENEVNVEVANAVKELERILSEDNSKTQSTAAVETEAETNAQTICISDDEYEPPAPSRTSVNLLMPFSNKHRICNKRLIKGVNSNGTPPGIIATILKNIAKEKFRKNAEYMKHFPIKGGPKEYIFKNIREYLSHFKIPLEIYKDNELKLSYKTTQPCWKGNVKQTWEHQTVIGANINPPKVTRITPNKGTKASASASTEVLIPTCLNKAAETAANGLGNLTGSIPGLVALESNKVNGSSAILPQYQVSIAPTCLNGVMCSPNSTSANKPFIIKNTQASANYILFTGPILQPLHSTQPAKTVVPPVQLPMDPPFNTNALSNDKPSTSQLGLRVKNINELS